MLKAFLDSLVPGMRDARGPLVSGLLWALWVWLMFADDIPSRLEAEGFVKQVYAVADAFGTGPTIAALTMIAYIVGILGVSLSDGLRRLFAIVWSGVDWLGEWHRWNTSARAARSSSQMNWEKATAKLKEATGTPREKAAKDKVHQANEKLEIFSTNVRLGVFFRRTPELRKIVESTNGSIEPRNERELASTAVEAAWMRGVAHELQQHDVNVLPRSIWHTSRGQRIDQLLHEDLGRQPLDALRAVDHALYQEVDRERAEREFRIAVMPPAVLITFSIWGATAPWSYLVGALAAWCFFQAARTQHNVPARILQLLCLKGTPLPSLNAAEFDGRSEAREGIAEAVEKAKKSVPEANATS